MPDTAPRFVKVMVANNGITQTYQWLPTRCERFLPDSGIVVDADGYAVPWTPAAGVAWPGIGTPLELITGEKARMMVEALVRKAV